MTPVVFMQLRTVSTSKYNYFCILFIMLTTTTTCFGHCEPSSGNKMYIGENYTECDQSMGAYSKLSTRSRCRLDFKPKILIS